MKKAILPDIDEYDFSDSSLNLSSNSKFLKRRDYPRFFTKHINMNIELDFEDISNQNKISVKGKILNLSQQGVAIYINSLLSISQRIHFKLDLPSSYEKVEGTGRIIWGMEKNNSYQYGVCFYDIHDQVNALTLAKFLYDSFSNDELSDRRSKDRRKSRVIKSNIDNRKTDRRITKPLFLKCLRYNRVKKLVDKDQYYFFREIQSGNNHRIIRNGKELVNYASNNYLGLANHPAVIESSIKAIEKYGTGTTGARMLNGTMDLHNQLEEKLAKFKGGEDCMLCSSGYHTNVGVISALIAKNNHIIIDNKCHASIVDGCWLSGGKISIFKHNNLKDLESVLQGIDINSPKIIIVDGVYSMDGDLAKLDFIYKIGEKYKSVIMVDDAHAVGVIGKTGRGTSEHFDLQGKIDLMVGTLSKALGGIGGFVVASKKIIHYLKHNSRSFIFSASIPPANCAAALKALEIIEKDLTWHTKLWNNITYLKKALVISGFDIGNSASAIIPVIVKDEILTYKITGMLEKQGIYVNAIAYPAVRKRAARLRVSVMATHNQEDLDLFINKIRKLGRQFNIIEN